MKTLRGFSYVLLLAVLTHPKGFSRDRFSLPVRGSQTCIALCPADTRFLPSEENRTVPM